MMVLPVARGLIVAAALAAVLVPVRPVLHAQQPPAPSSWNQRFRASLEATRIGASVRRLSARPHHLGSAYGRDNAEWIKTQFESWGWKARIDAYDVLFPVPTERVLELVAPHRFTASLVEPPEAVDPTSHQQAEQLPAYHAYAADGDVTAPLVYVNYGRPVDYDVLEAQGISVRGAIVIARYGGSWRGIKPKVAAERGAIGCLIYSDPRDDGYFVDGVFPTGPMRNRQGVQRGSVVDLPMAPGDPLTPGVGATPEARRLDRAAAPTLMRIPVLPISSADAEPLLAALDGPVAPLEWRGALPLTYRLGPGPARVHLKLAFAWQTSRAYNVIAEITGGVYPEEWIMRGNHHDAWVNGAADPGSGMAAVLEEARVLGALVAQGWRPKRTIIYAAWDGEEPGLLGSTEWVEDHAREIDDHLVAYINSDGNGRGFLDAGGSHALESFLTAVARDVVDPETSLSVWARARARAIQTTSGAARADVRARADLRLDALGSGSDYTPFLQHAGVATLNLSFGGQDSSAGVYHSIYDDVYHYTTFLDTDFAYGRALAEVAGTVVMRLADAELLPFGFSNLAETVQRYVGELAALLKERQDEVRERNRQIAEGVFTAVRDRKRPTAVPAVEEVPPALNFAPLENAAAALTRAAERYRAAAAAAAPRLAANPTVVPEVNARLRQAERQLTDPAGLPRRPWYRHLLYAPGFYTGYGVKTMPGVREAIEEKGYLDAEREAGRVAEAIRREAALIDGAAADLERLAAP